MDILTHELKKVKGRRINIKKETISYLKFISIFLIVSGISILIIQYILQALYGIIVLNSVDHILVILGLLTITTSYLLEKKRDNFILAFVIFAIPVSYTHLTLPTILRV